MRCEGKGEMEEWEGGKGKARGALWQIETRNMSVFFGEPFYTVSQKMAQL